MTKIVRDIRAEGTGPRQQHIDLHFVLSNVPDLDDEDSALHQMLSNFQIPQSYRALEARSKVGRGAAGSRYSGRSMSDDAPTRKFPLDEARELMNAAWTLRRTTLATSKRSL